MKIMDHKEQILSRQIILYVKVHGRNHSKMEATKELEFEIREKYSELFQSSGTLSLKD